MKKIVIFLVVLLFLIIGCISPTLNQASFEDFEDLKENYEVKNSFSPNLILMNDYIIDLTELRTRSSFNLAAVIDADIYSAKSFYYYSIAGKTINLITINKCTQKERNDIMNYYNLAEENANVAIEKLRVLSETDLSNLRENQLELIEQIKANSQGYLQNINNFC